VKQKQFFRFPKKEVR
jgi:hypothetical protein